MFDIYDIVTGRKRKPGTNQGLTVADAMIAQGADLVPYAEHPEMPCDEILLALLDFVSRHYAGRGHMRNRLDFSALVGLAVMCEDELQQALGENGHLMYAQEKQE